MPLRTKIIGFILSALFVLDIPVIAQMTKSEFGKNRVQYHNFEWSFLKSDHFVTYFYLGGQDIGKYVVLQAEKDLNEIQRKLEYKTSERIEILVFNDIADLKQSNIGIDVESYNVGGVTKIVGNRIFLHFDGNHRNLRKKLREGIAGVLINDMMYGGNIQEVLQNAVLLSLPGWFNSGIVSYVGEDWNVDMDNRLREGILSGRFKKINRLSGDDARLAGHSIARYISEKYGNSAIPSLLYLTRLNRNLESGFSFVLGGTISEITDNWYQFYYQKYTEDYVERDALNNAAILPVKLKKHISYSSLALNPDTLHVAYKSNDLGRIKIHLDNLETGKRKRIMRVGYRTLKDPIDINYPLFKWTPDGTKLAIIYEKRDDLNMLFYNIHTKEKEHYDLTKFQRITGMNFIDKETLVFSAMNRGQTDIYTYHIPSSKTEKITNDYYDELEPAYVKLNNDKEGIVFISNRETDSVISLQLDTNLPTATFDVYFYDLKSKTKTATKISRTAVINESSPVQYDNKHIAYLSASNGIQNRTIAYLKTIFSHFNTYVQYKDSTTEMIINGSPQLILQSGDSLIDSIWQEAIYKDTAYTFPVTNLNNNILEQDILPDSKFSIDKFYINGRTYFYKNRLPQNPRESMAPFLIPTTYQTGLINAQNKLERQVAEKIKNQKPATNILKDTNTITEPIIRPYYLQSEFTYPNNNYKIYTGSTDTIWTQNQEEKQKEENTNKQEQKEAVFKPTHILPYRLKFTTEYVTTQLDNGVIFNRYQSFTSQGPVFQNPALSPLIKVGTYDLLEDFKFVGGFRIPTSLGGGEYFATFDNLKKRTDKKLLYYRKNSSGSFADGNSYKLKADYWQLSFSRPFDVLKSIRTHFAYRNDRIVYLASDQNSLNTPDLNDRWVFGKVEYVYDNAIDPFTNIHRGIRYKIYGEYHKRLEEKNQYIGVVGGDFRYYQKIHRQLTWATRVSAATSFGTKKLVYYLGGVDNWIVPKFNTSTRVDLDANYAFQTLATNLRGFSQNIRNGNSHVLVNTEIRFPVFAYFLTKPIKSEFIRNFQFNFFGDIGTAWQGPSPFARDNPSNTEIIGGPPKPILIKINYYQNPIVGGYGVGVRSIVFGYFVRADLAWGVHDGFIEKPLFYLSFILDF